MWSFTSGVLNQIPVVGHGKALLHEMVGDREGARTAFKQSTRSAAVCAGGLAGGPLGAVGAGLAADAVMTAATQEPQGVLRSACNIGEDISRGKIPIRSTIETILTPACDALGGEAAGKVFQSAAKITALAPVLAEESTKIAVKSSVQKIIVKEAVVVGANIGKASIPVVCGMTREKRLPTYSSKKIGGYPGWVALGASLSSSSRNSSNNSTRSNTETKTETKDKGTPPASQGSSSGSSSGGPPNNPPRRNTNTTTKTREDILWEVLMALQELFPYIKPHEYNRLRLLINTIIDNGFDMRILLIALSLCKQVNADFDVMMFASLAEFVMAYVGEQLFEVTESSPTHSNISTTHAQLRINMVINLHVSNYVSNTLLNRLKKFFKEVLEINFNGLPNFSDLLKLFNDLRHAIKKHPGYSRFRDLYSALYHYYKHRKVVCKRTGTVKILTVKEYFDLIEHIYQEIQYTAKYQRMKRTQSGEETDRWETVNDIIHISSFEIYGRRFKLVIKLQNGRIVVSSCHWLDYNK